MDYLLQTDPDLGGVGLMMLLVWLGALAFGVMTLRAPLPANPARAAFRRRIAMTAAVLGGIAVVQLLLRWVEAITGTLSDDMIPVIDLRIWSYLLLLIGLVAFGYWFWFYRTRYRQQVASTKSVRVVKPTQQRRAPAATPATNGTPAAQSEPRPVATTTRREARRDRKRRTR